MSVDARRALLLEFKSIRPTLDSEIYSQAILGKAANVLKYTRAM